MKEFFIILILNIIASVHLIAQNQMAIYVVGDASNSYKKVIASSLTQTVNSDGHFQAVERTDAFLGALGHEISYQNSGVVSQTRISELGRQFGAQYVFIVDLNNVLGELYASSRIINVENNTVEAASDESSEVETMSELKDLASRISSSTLAKLPYNVQKKQQAEKDKFLQQQLKFKNQYTTTNLYYASNIYECYRDYSNISISKETALRYIQACKDLGISVNYPVYYKTELISRGTPYKVGKSGKYQTEQIKAYCIYSDGRVGSGTWNIQVDLNWSKKIPLSDAKVVGCFLHR